MPRLVTEQHRRPATPEAAVALDERGQALLKLLPEIFNDLEPQVSAAVDEAIAAVKPEHILQACRISKEDPRLAFNYLRCLSGVDYQDRFEVVYHPYSLEKGHKMVLKTSVPPDQPRVPSVVTVWRAADWFEREGADLFGIEFEGHPNLAPLILYEGFEGYPGRKSFPFHDYDEW